MFRDAGDPRVWGVFPGNAGNRALPGPSPSANLAGIWKGKRLKHRPPLPAVFYFLPFLPLLLRRRTYAIGTNLYLNASGFALVFGMELVAQKIFAET